MKTVNVFVCIQMDIPNQDEDQVSEVTQILERINDICVRYPDETSHSQILISDVDASNIVDQDEEFNIDDEVELPDPNPLRGDLWNFSFTGTIVDIRGMLADVEDGNGDVFSIELSRLIKV